LALLTGLALAVAPPPPGPTYKLSGPLTHDNLTVFLVHGADQVRGNILTLDEALTQKKVLVHETKNVEHLAIENVSASEEVFVQAGDIVKGGQQDRTIARDLLLPPKSGRVSLGAFCVERGRWSGRPGESVNQFDSSKGYLATNALRLACRKAAAQGEVWKNVEKAQMDLGKKLKADVKDAKSATSLQLTLEHKKVAEAVEGYVQKLQPALDKQTDVIGYAVAVNGEVLNADVYANAALFRKLWPKLLRASAVEAVAEKGDKKFDPVAPAAVTAFLAEPAKGKRSEKSLGKGQREVQKETDRNILFETRANGVRYRASILAK
jgi:hypothetical protein